MKNTTILIAIVVLVLLAVLYVTVTAPSSRYTSITTTSINAATTVFNFSTSVSSIPVATTASQASSGGLNASSLIFVQSIPVGADPYGIAVSSNSSLVYVLNPRPEEISVVSALNNTMINTINITNGYATGGIAVTPDGKYLYVPVIAGPDTGAGQVQVISTSNGSLEAAINSGFSPQGIVIAPNGQYAYVMNSASSNISVISIPDSKVIQTINDGYGAYLAAITPDSNYLYVINGHNSTISVISTASDKVIQAISNPSAEESGGIAITPNGQYAYVTGLNATNYTVLSVISISKNAIIKEITLPRTNTAQAIPTYGPPGDVAISPNGRYAYITQNWNPITVISTLNNTIINTLSINDDVNRMAIAPNGNNAYASDQFYNTLLVLSLTNST